MDIFHAPIAGKFISFMYQVDHSVSLASVTLLHPPFFLPPSIHGPGSGMSHLSIGLLHIIPIVLRDAVSNTKV